MMKYQTTKGIVESLLFEVDREQLSVVHTVQATCNKVNQMSYFLRSAMTILNLVFNFHGLIRRGKWFYLQTPKQKCQQVSKWRKSQLGICRDYIGFYEKLAFFVYFSQEGEV